jgi:hypothetical protein
MAHVQYYAYYETSTREKAEIIKCIGDNNTRRRIVYVQMMETFPSNLYSASYYVRATVTVCLATNKNLIDGSI